jgi:hypothetical protein
MTTMAASIWGDECLSRRRAPGKHRSKARCVYQAHSRLQKRAGSKDLHARYSLRILRVLPLRDVFFHTANWDIRPRCTLKADTGG